MTFHLRNLMLVITAVGFFLTGCGLLEPEEPTVIVEDDDDDDLNVGQDNDANDNDSNNNTEPGDGYDGDACQQDQDCHSDICLVGSDWPGGHCSTVGCQSSEDCHSQGDENACLNNPQGDNFCARLCTPSASDECRDGYECLPFSEGSDGWCSPSTNNGGGGDPGSAEFEAGCTDVTFQSAEFDYDIDSSTESYMVVPYTTGGGYLSPTEILPPSGVSIDFQGDNAFQISGGAQLFGVINPTVVPAIPQFSYQLESGKHTYRLQTDDDEICYYVVEDPGSATSLDLNIYLVGLSGIDADNAATNPDMQQMMGEVETIFAQSNIDIRETRYLSVSPQAEQDYAIIRGYDDVSGLAEHSEAPGDTEEDLLSANVFITQQFSMSGGGGVLGISLGIPGAAGMHGSGLSGVAMTGEYIGEGVNGNTLSANILAHELGHFLGLFHTSEQDGQSFDPLQDTPECSDMSNPTHCPDWGNLMFPGADIGNNELTSDQSHVIGVNPLTQ